MALTEETIVDKIEIVGDYRHVQVRTATVIKRDGVEISRSFHRHVVSPDKDTKDEDDFVKSICNLVHTDKVKADYLKMLSDQEAEMVAQEK
jgi:hypothetical protein